MKSIVIENTDLPFPTLYIHEPLLVQTSDGEVYLVAKSTQGITVIVVRRGIGTANHAVGTTWHGKTLPDIIGNEYKLFRGTVTLENGK